MNLQEKIMDTEQSQKTFSLKIVWIEPAFLAEGVISELRNFIVGIEEVWNVLYGNFWIREDGVFLLGKSNRMMGGRI